LRWILGEVLKVCWVRFQVEFENEKSGC
jgi:hypothetical protein